jgi:short-subunit dehydrogenase
MDAKQYGPWAVIAGGSEGVGASFARKLAAKGINLVLLARKPEPLDAVAKDVRQKYPNVSVRPLPLDLTAPDMLARVRKVTDDVEVGMLIYNAGAEHSLKRFHDKDLATAERMIGLNVIGPTRLVHHFGGAMRERRRGGIILVGSTAGYAGGPMMAMYSATKAFDCMLAEALWHELGAYNVHVLGLILGATRTPAVERIGMVMDSPDYPAAEPDDVAQEGFDHLGVDPIWHTGGTEHIAQAMRSMPRAEAIRLIAAGVAAVNPEQLGPTTH